jgi:hypothetical protein
MATEILASTDDVNSYLPGRESGGSTSGYPVVVEATEENTAILQVSIARSVRGYLSGVIDGTTLMSWVDPGTTPDIIREIAGMLIAARLYFNHTSRTSLTINDDNFAQRLYDRAIGLLDKIISGEIALGPEVPVETAAMSDDDYFPVDDTDRAFTMGMQL